MITAKTSKVFRGIAILMVIASHYAAAMYVEPLRPAAKEFISKLGVYGVDIFFLLSGYGLVKSYEKTGIDRAFVLKRIMNTYVPYLLVIGFFAIIEKGITTPMDVVYFLIGYDYWFMAVLFAMYLMFMIIYKIGKFKEIFITIAILGFTYWLYSIEKADFWELSNGAFLIGIYAASLEHRFGDKVEEVIRKINLVAIASGVTMLGAYIYTGNGEMWAHMLTSMSFTVAVLGLCAISKCGGVILPSIGRYSLYVYLLHLRLFWKIVMYRDAWSYVRGAVTAGIVTLVVCVAVGYSIEWNLKFITDKLLKK